MAILNQLWKITLSNAFCNNQGVEFLLSQTCFFDESICATLSLLLSKWDWCVKSHTSLRVYCRCRHVIALCVSWYSKPFFCCGKLSGACNSGCSFDHVSRIAVRNFIRDNSGIHSRHGKPNTETLWHFKNSGLQLILFKPHFLLRVFLNWSLWPSCSLQRPLLFW